VAALGAVVAVPQLEGALQVLKSLGFSLIFG
jgi:hypothetical protein